MSILNSVDNPYGTTTGTSQIIPTHDIHDDIVWNKGAHTISFGTEFLIIHNHYDYRLELFQYSDRRWPVPAGRRWSAAAGGCDAQLDAPSTFMDTLLGLQAKLQTRANYDLQGNTLPQGAPVVRIFKEQHYDLYAQDSWKVTRGLNISLGLRLGLNPAIYETQGYNVELRAAAGQFWANRIALNTIGESAGSGGQCDISIGRRPRARVCTPSRQIGRHDSGSLTPRKVTRDCRSFCLGAPTVLPFASASVSSTMPSEKAWNAISATA